jgi:outer membrane protein insertion porin family
LRRRIFFVGILMSLLAFSGAFAAEPIVSAVNVEGNDKVVAEHILAAVGTKVGDTLEQQQVKADVEAIYSLGFFSFVDVKLAPLAGGVEVVFQVKENPVVEEIRFEGNTVYTDEELMELVFTSPGSVFNREFFRHDLQRIKEKYDNDGYVLAKIADVSVEGGIIGVKLIEPKVGDIIIQGNTKTKTHVIERHLTLKKGDLFNSTLLRYSVKKINALGFFEDVSIGFEPSEEDQEATNVIITVKEAKTGKIGFTIGHGSNSGWSGGISYGDSNWQGLAHSFEIGFELGDDEEYWASYSQPYMDRDTYAWKVGAYTRDWNEKEYWDDGYEQFEYDEEKTGGYFGFGKKFPNDDKLSWFLTFDWRDTEISNVVSGDATDEEIVDYISEDFVDGTVFSTILTLTNNNLDPYLPYRQGDIEDINIEKAWEVIGGEYDFTKYWTTVRYYLPLFALGDIVDTQMGDEDNPPIFAARVRAGFSSGTVPFAERYEIGGSRTLRGYEDDAFEGDEMFLGNFEFRLPIDKTVGIVLFYDTGNAWSGEDGFSLSDLYDSYGFGVRVKTPLGNLRVDYGEGDDESKTHFGFGEMF